MIQPLVNRWFHNVSGYSRYLFGERAGPHTALARARVCANCPTLQVHLMKDFRILRLLYRSPMMGWCGAPRSGLTEGVSCGCPVLAEYEAEPETIPITIEGETINMVPCGKTLVQQSRCPQAKW